MNKGCSLTRHVIILFLNVDSLDSEEVIMPTVREKEKIEKVIQSLPDDAHIEDAMERLYLLYKVEKGCQQADAGQTVSHEEAKRRLQEWLD